MGIEANNGEDWVAFTEQKWNAKNSYAYVDPITAYRDAFIAMGVQKNNYVILSALAQSAAVEAVLSLEAKVLFVDIQEENAQIDLEVLENFLSLATIVNEHNQLIYRKDNQCIRCIVLDHHFGVINDSQKVLFTAMRYQLKVLEDLTEVLGRKNEHPVGQSGHLIIVQLSQGCILMEIPTPEIFKLASFGELEEVNISNPPKPSNEENILKDLNLVYTVKQGLTQKINTTPAGRAWNYNENAIHPVIFFEQAASLRSHLTKTGLIGFRDLEKRVAQLKNNTFLNKAKIAFRFLMETVILPANPEKQSIILEEIEQFIHNH